jgi:hypothetical protein
VLDPDLKDNPREHERILLHEFFHFVWVRLGNPLRHAWEELLRAERESRARGEAGWSSEWRKRDLSDRDVARRSRDWREYCCESFCDTGAFVAGGDDREVTLARKRLAVRAAWFKSKFGEGAFSI